MNGKVIGTAVVDDGGLESGAGLSVLSLEAPTYALDVPAAWPMGVLTDVAKNEVYYAPIMDAFLGVNVSGALPADGTVLSGGEARPYETNWGEGTAQVRWTMAAAGVNCRAEALAIWLNAFIPRDVPGVTREVPGPEPRRTAVPGPVESFNDCYLGDQRSWDTDLNASVRMQSRIHVDLGGQTALHIPRAGNWIEVDCEDGSVEDEETSSTEGLALGSQSWSDDGSRYEAYLVGKATIPHFEHLPLVEYSTEYQGRIKVIIDEKRTFAQVSFEGKVDHFPAFELYAALSADGEHYGIPVTVFQKPPADGVGAFERKPGNRSVGGEVRVMCAPYLGPMPPVA